MTEDDAKSWILERYGRAGFAAMERIVEAVINEAPHQNLVAPSTLATIWSRHIVDSAQLLGLAGNLVQEDIWVDVGSGAGFPGLVIAALSQSQIVMIDPRKRRISFIERVLATLDIGTRARVICSRVEPVRIPATIISARAVGRIDEIFSWASGCNGPATRWILPRGRTGRDEVANVPETWQGLFHVEQSITNVDSVIVLASGVAQR